MYETTLLDAD